MSYQIVGVLRMDMQSCGGGYVGGGLYQVFTGHVLEELMDHEGERRQGVEVDPERIFGCDKTEFGFWNSMHKLFGIQFQEGKK